MDGPSPALDLGPDRDGLLLEGARVALVGHDLLEQGAARLQREGREVLAGARDRVLGRLVASLGHGAPDGELEGSDHDLGLEVRAGGLGVLAHGVAPCALGGASCPATRTTVPLGPTEVNTLRPNL